MNLLRQKLSSSAALARVFPFAVFVVLTVFQDRFGEPARYWIYFLKTVAGAWALWMVRPFVAEMKWNFSWQAVTIGVGVFAVWIGLEGLYPQYDSRGSPWNPLNQFQEAPALGAFFVFVRIAGTTLVVPLIEEVFYRSFLYRFFVRSDFETVRLNEFHSIAFLVCAIVFGAVHQQWLPGIICGASFQWLVWKKNRLGDAVTAHAIANFLLGVWVIWRGAWQFW